MIVLARVFTPGMQAQISVATFSESGRATMYGFVIALSGMTGKL